MKHQDLTQGSYHSEVCEEEPLEETENIIQSEELPESTPELAVNEGETGSTEAKEPRRRRRGQGSCQKCKRRGIVKCCESGNEKDIHTDS